VAEEELESAVGDLERIWLPLLTAGTNPLRHQVETAPEPDPETSRKLLLRMKKESGFRLDAMLLRSVDWIEAVGARECGTFFLDLPEMGAVGDAYVEAILPCPPIEDGPGNVVTGVFAHEADGVTHITKIESRFARPGEMLYNLETHNQKTGYFVRRDADGNFLDIDGAIIPPGPDQITLRHIFDTSL
jgi:hypothetical protein